MTFDIHKISPALLTSALFMSTAQLDAVEIRNYQPSRHDRFVGFPSDLTPNPTFYLKDEDWSGFGWSVQDTRKHFTLISRKHFVGARHFRPAVGQQVRFLNRDGMVKTYTVESRHDVLNDEDPAVPSDVFVGELVETVSDSDRISIVPVLNLDAEADYVGEDLIVSGRGSRAGEATIATIEDIGGEPGSILNETRGLSFIYTEPGFGGDAGRLVDGDSGGPSAVLTSGGFALVGTHSAVSEFSLFVTTTYTNYDTFVPHYLARIDAILEEDGYQVTRVNGDLPDLSLTLLESGDPALSSNGVSYTLTISNSATGEIARNLSLELSCDAGATFATVDSPGWVVENGGTTLTARRGALGSDDSTSLVVTLALSDQPTGPVAFSASLDADGSASLTASESTEVMQSYQSWAAQLPMAGQDDDPDGDGVSNGLEYALGRDGGMVEDEEPLVFALSASGLTLTYSQRSFASELGVEVFLESSSDLVQWNDVLGAVAVTAEESYQVEAVTQSLPMIDREFFRLRIGSEE